jgi:hypothetical protein
MKPPRAEMFFSGREPPSHEEFLKVGAVLKQLLKDHGDL